MWLRFIKNTEANRIGDVVWVGDYSTGAGLVDLGVAARCIDNRGASFEESAPEEVEVAIKNDGILDEDKKKRQGYLW